MRFAVLILLFLFGCPEKTKKQEEKPEKNPFSQVEKWAEPTVAMADSAKIERAVSASNSEEKVALLVAWYEARGGLPQSKCGETKGLRAMDAITLANLALEHDRASKPVAAALYLGSRLRQEGSDLLSVAAGFAMADRARERFLEAEREGAKRRRSGESASPYPSEAEGAGEAFLRFAPDRRAGFRGLALEAVCATRLAESLRHSKKGAKNLTDAALKLEVDKVRSFMAETVHETNRLAARGEQEAVYRYLEERYQEARDQKRWLVLRTVAIDVGSMLRRIDEEVAAYQRFLKP